MRTPPRPILLRAPRAAANVALLALAAASASAVADEPAPNAGMRYVGVDAQADNRHDTQVVTTLSLPVGRQGWVQAGAGKARTDAAAGGHRPAIVSAAAGVAGKSWQLAGSASQRADGTRYRQTDVGASLDWRHGGSGVGFDVTHRHARSVGTVAALDGTPAPAQARVSGTGVGGHGTLQVSEHVSVYGSAMRNHYKSRTTQADSSNPGGLLGSNPVLSRALFGGVSVVDRDEVALDRGAQVGMTYRWAKVALSGEYTTGQVHDGGGAMRAVDVKAAIDVAPGWRVAPGIGCGTSDQGGHATFATLSAVYGW